MESHDSTNCTTPSETSEIRKKVRGTALRIYCTFFREKQQQKSFGDTLALGKTAKILESERQKVRDINRHLCQHAFCEKEISTKDNYTPAQKSDFSFDVS